jgi:hypothetical protein
MFVIKKILIYDVNAFAKVIVPLLPDFEVDTDKVDGYGQFDQSFKFDVEFKEEGITIAAMGKVRAQGVFRKVFAGTWECPPEYDFKQVNEIDEIKFFFNDEPVKIKNEYDVINKINEMI